MGLKVLWVDDEPHSLRYEHKLAQRYGWELHFASTAQEALDVTARDRFDLLILDIILPQNQYYLDRGFVHEDSGLKLLATLKEPSREALTPHDVPIGVITAVISPDKRAQIIKLLPSDQFYLSKPINEKEYLALLKRLNEAASSKTGSQ